MWKTSCSAQYCASVAKNDALCFRKVKSQKIILYSAGFSENQVKLSLLSVICAVS